MLLWENLLEIANYHNYHYCVAENVVENNKKNARNRETMMKIRVVIIFIIAQVALTKLVRVLDVQARAAVCARHKLR